MSELKPCPFCGGTHLYIDGYDHASGNGGDGMKDLITEARELCEKVTPGPWISEPMTSKKARRGGGNYFRVAREKLFVNICHYLTKHDADFIAVSRTLVPQLCDALEAAQKELIDYHHTQKTVDGKMVENARLRRIIDKLNARAEKAEAEIDRLKTKLMLSEASEHPQDLFPELTPQQRAENAEIVALTIRAEKAEAKIKSIHESLNFADKSRSKCANYVELAVSNGLALGRIAVAIQHDYDAEPPKGV